MTDSLILAAVDLDRDNAELTRQLAAEIETCAALRAELARLAQVVADMSGTAVAL